MLSWCIYMYIMCKFVAYNIKGLKAILHLLSTAVHTQRANKYKQMHPVFAVSSK